MGSVFFVVGLLVLLAIGMTGIVVGVIGLIVGNKKKHLEDPSTKALTIVFAVVLSLGILITLIPIGSFSLIVIVNEMPPYGFVETEIVIEENGYQDTRFTADGVVYEVLNYQIYDTNTMSDPVFAYKTKGFLNGSQCGNYYAVENAQGFNLVCDEFGTLFSPVEEKERVIEHYTSTENLCGYYDDWCGREVKLSDEETRAVQFFLDAEVESLNKERTIVTEDENEEEFEIKFICKEKIVCVESHWFLVLNDTMYYVYDSDFTEEDGFAYLLVELPSDIAEPLMDIHQNS